MDVLLKYSNQIKIVPEGKNTLGEGIQSYKQPKRQAYRVADDGMYGGLLINQPRLMNEMVIEAHRGGQIVYENNDDKSLIDLLMKRFNPKKRYSSKAIQILYGYTIVY